MMPDRSIILPVFLWFFALLCAVSPFGDYRLEATFLCVLSMYAYGFTVLAQGLKGEWGVPKSAAFMLMALFWALTVSSLLWSGIPSVTVLYIGLFSVMPLGFLCSAVAGRAEIYKWVAWLGVPVFAALGLWAITQNLFLNKYFWGQARHPLGDPSALGALLSLALFCALGWMLAEQRKAWKYAALALSLVLIGGVFATVARGPVFALVPAIILFLALLCPQVKKARGCLIAFFAGACLIYAGLELNPAKAHDLSGEIFQTVKMEGDISNARFSLWQSTWEMIKDRPFSGTGFGTFFQYLPEYKRHDYTAAVYHAHNDPLQFWAELGIAGILLFYAFGVAAAGRTFAALKNLHVGQERERIAIVTVFAALTAMAVQAHVSFLLYTLPVLLVAGFLLAVWFHVTRDVLKDKMLLQGKEDDRGMGHLVALALPFLLMGGLYASVMAGDYYTNKAQRDLISQDMDSFAAHINRSGHISLGLNYRSYLLAVNVPLSILAAEKSSLTDGQRAELYHQAENYMENVLARNPRAPSAYFYLAKAQEFAGPDIVPDGAPTMEALYQKALFLDPLHLQSRLALYDLHVREKRGADDLAAVLLPAEDMYFNSPLAEIYYQKLVQYYLERGNYGKAQDTMQKLADFRRRSDLSKKRTQTPMIEALLGGEKF